MVKPEEISDLDAVRLVRDIRKRIEEELDYPGHIKVSLFGKLVQLIMLNNKNTKRRAAAKATALLFVRHEKNIAIIIFYSTSQDLFSIVGIDSF